MIPENLSSLASLIILNMAAPPYVPQNTQFSPATINAFLDSYTIYKSIDASVSKGFQYLKKKHVFVMSQKINVSNKIIIITIF